jgi:sugar O-acyltransferase (sialic acid O-acetyltransferase NeuD family)
LLVLGTTAFAAEIADVAESSGEFEVTGFVENLDRERCAERHAGLPVHWIDEIDELSATHVAVCGLGTTRRSIFTDQAAARGLSFATVVHPTAHVSRTSTVGEGSIVGAGTIVAAHTTIGRHVLLNRASSVGHHTSVGDFVSIQTAAHVAGSCAVGRAAFVAMGAIVVDHVNVGEEAVVGAGAVVLKDVPPNVQVVGAPARVVKHGIEGR